MSYGPKYRKIFTDLKEKVDNGDLKPGDKIPSTTELCATYNCSATVVNTAVVLLADTGYIIGIPGLGRFVANP